MELRKLASIPRVGLDCDGVLASFSQHFIDKAVSMGLGAKFPKCADDVREWMFCDKDDFLTVWQAIEHDADWWLSIPAFPAAQKFFRDNPDFRPELYITKRPVPSDITKAWLTVNGFPTYKIDVITVNDTTEKYDIVKARCDIYTDDLIETVRDLRAMDVNALLFHAPYHLGQDVSDLPTIYDLSELSTKGALVTTGRYTAA